MNEGFDLGLASTGSLAKKGYSFILSNVGKTVAVITLAVSALVSFTEISFSGISSKSFTSTLVMMLIASYVMYFSLADAGERLGRESEKYKKANEEYARLQSEIKGSHVSHLRDFCLKYRNAELEYRRENLLCSLGYTKEEYERYLGGEKMPKKMEKDLYRVKKTRSGELDASTLMTRDKRQKSELENPESARLWLMLLRLVPTTVCMLFTVSVMISVKDNMTAAGIVEALLKLSTLPIIGLKGYSGGYEYVTVTELGWLKTKIRLIETFLKEYEAKETGTI